MTRPPVADWLPPALREAPDAGRAPRLLDAAARGVERAAPAARAGHRRGLGRLLHRELRRLGGALHRRAARPARRRRSPRGRLCRRAAPAQGHAGRARGLRGGSHRLDGSRARGLADHGLGPAAPPSAAAARRLVRPSRRLALPRRDAVRARPPQLHAVGAVVAARGDGGRLAVAGADVPRGRGRAAARGRPLRAASARRRGAALPQATAAAALERRRRRGGALAHRRRARRAGPRDLPRRRGARRAGPDHLRRQLASSTPSTRSPPARGRTRRRCSRSRSTARRSRGTSSASARCPPGAPAPAPPAAGRGVVDLARGHVELGSALTGTLRATWHRPVPGELGALASDADVDPAARVVVDVDPGQPATGNIVKTLGAAFTKAEALERRPQRRRLGP